MIYIPGGTYYIGTDSKEGFEYDFELPRTKVTIAPFMMDATAITNANFMDFVNATGYITDAERAGWSYVFHYFVQDKLSRIMSVNKTPWWLAITNAYWYQPEGPRSSIVDRMHHPVVHVSRNDAVAYCQWSGKRLPTEAEWEIAAQGGTNLERFYWGEQLVQDGQYFCNTWQGQFPNDNTLADGYAGTSPVKAYPPNPYGLYDMIGNVWEWCVNPGRIALQTFCFVNGQDFWREHQLYDDERYAIKGGSFLCHDSYCNRYRMCGRNSNTAMSGSQNMGFRCVKDIE